MPRAMNEVMSKGRKRIAGTAALFLLLAGAAFAAGMGPITEKARGCTTGQTDRAASREALDSILQDLAAYDFAVGVGAPMRLRTYVLAHKDDPAARREIERELIAFLASEATAGGKMEVCRALRLIGGEASVPVLERMLADPATTDMARFALEGIPGEEPDQALLAALERTGGDVRRGIVASLGARGTGAAEGPLARLAAGKDAALALDAARALGAIGTGEAAAALSNILGKSKGALRTEVIASLLVCADRALQAGQGEAAGAIYEKVLAAKPPVAMRQAAFKGRIAAAGERGQDIILKVLAGKDAALHGPAIAMVPAMFEASALGPVIGSMAKLPTASKVQLVAVLGGYRSETVVAALLDAAQSPPPPVRKEALRSLEKVGNASAVADLAARAASSAGEEQALAREALAKLSGPDIDRAVIGYLEEEKDDAVRAELVRAVGARRISAAKPVLMEAVRSGPPAIRARASSALRDIASAGDIPDLIDLLLAVDDEAGREEMQNTVAAVALKIPRPTARANAVKARLDGENDPKKKADLLRVLGKIGEDGALAVIRRALSDTDPYVVDAAVRALVEWPTATARDDVFWIARTSLALNHRILALRAYVRMIGLELHRSPEGATADLLKALALAPRPEEKKLILGMLARFPCVPSLKAAESLLADPTVAAEAKLAADRIRGQISIH